jgi:hypothetical protein
VKDFKYYTPVLYLTLYSRPTTKKKQIWKLIEMGKLSPAQIAFQVGTTVKNVWKESSNFRKHTGTTVRGTRTIEHKIQQKDEVILFNSTQEVRDARDIDIIRHQPNSSLNASDHHTQHLALPERDAESFKTLYKGFRSQKTPVDMIARCGFHPDAVVVEYRRYMQINEADIHELLREIIFRAEDCVYYQADIRPISDTYKSRGFLKVAEIMHLLELWKESEIESRLHLLLSDPETRLPGPFKRWRCKKCKTEVPDVIINPRSPFGKYMLDKYENLICAFCSEDSK